MKIGCPPVASDWVGYSRIGYPLVAPDWVNYFKIGCLPVALAGPGTRRSAARRQDFAPKGCCAR